MVHGLRPSLPLFIATSPKLLNASVSFFLIRGHYSTWLHQASLVALLQLTANTKDTICPSNQRFSRLKKMCNMLGDFLTPIVNHFRMTRQPPTPTHRRSPPLSPDGLPRLSGGFKMQHGVCDLSAAPHFPSLTQMGRHAEDADAVWQGVHALPCPYRSIIHRRVSSQSSRPWSFLWIWMVLFWGNSGEEQEEKWCGIEEVIMWKKSE